MNDTRGNPLAVGDKIAFAQRVGNFAEMRFGEVVGFTERRKYSWAEDRVPILLVQFEDGKRVSRLENLHNVLRLS